MKILLFLPNSFEHMESSVFIDVFGWAQDYFNSELVVETASFTREVNSTFGVPVVVRQLIDEISAADYDALALPGGFQDCGYFEEAYQEPLLRLIRDFHSRHKPIATVCVAALVLGKSGILEGRRATTYHLDGDRRIKQLKAYGAVAEPARLIVDDNLITSCGPETAVWVAFQLLEMLTGSDTADAVKKAMGYIENTRPN